MANKITCTCGHSWNKSDSSKKDAYVCHICGKDIKNMQLGGNVYSASYVPQAEEGWLSKYKDGGSMQEHQENYNDSSVYMGPGFVGMGNNTKGRNYSPAWGGQFQDGGNLTFLEPTSRKLPKGYVIPYNTPSTELAMSIGGEGDEPAYLIPSFKYGKPLKDAVAEFRRTGEHLGGPFKTWQEADEWERTVRHPYVEKGQNIPTPIKRSGKDFAMGGSMPGSVGFTYARTIDPAPSNGPYAKKTKASAQDGAWLDKYDVPQAQEGTKAKWQERLAEEAAKLDNPLSTLQLSKKGFSKDNIKTIQKTVAKEQPVIQTPKGKQLSREEILARNKQYALEAGKVFNPESGSVSNFLSPGRAKNLERGSESIMNAANYVMTAPQQLVQSLYKQGYSAEDALSGKPSGSSLGEDILTDPTMLASLGLKGLGKLALKGLGKGAIGKGLMSSAILPFYKSVEAGPYLMREFTSKLNQVKDMITSPEARDSFRRIGDVITRDPNITALDESYARAITDPNLPERAIDTYANSILSIDPAENKLSPEQLKYLNRITGLTTDVSNIHSASDVEKLHFLIDNSKQTSPRDIQISPRDMLPFFYGNLSARNISNEERRALLSKLYSSYGGLNTINPLAEKSAAADLFTLADNYSRNSPLASDIGIGIKELGEHAGAARTKVHINDQYWNPRYANDNANDVIFSMFGNSYRGIPSREQRGQQAVGAARKALSAMNQVLDDPQNRGKFYVSSKSLSSDSQPLGLGMLANKKDAVDIVPVHGGEPYLTSLYTNPAGGLSKYNNARSNYLETLKTKFDKSFGPSNYSAYHMPPNMPYFESPAQRLQKQMLEVSYYNHHLDKFNKAVGTNMPSAIFSENEGYITRPNVGMVIRKEGGIVKDDMGYWNSDNWGKPVEIGSNNITMQGVDEDLIGISDEGDIKHMKANNPKNYKFKGNKVTEYPVKKNWLEKYK